MLSGTRCNLTRHFLAGAIVEEEVVVGGGRGGREGGAGGRGIFLKY